MASVNESGCGHHHRRIVTAVGFCVSWVHLEMLPASRLESRNTHTEIGETFIPEARQPKGFGDPSSLMVFVIRFSCLTSQVRLYLSGNVGVMEATFANPRLQRVCNSEKAMIKTYGPECAKRLRVRLAAIQAVDNAAELFELPGRWHPLRSNLSGTISGDLAHPLRLLIAPTDINVSDEQIDWGRVTRVTVIGIEDTHEG
jgi:toxin HigB-1